MHFDKIGVYLIIGLVLTAFSLGYLLGDGNMRQETDITDQAVLEIDDWRADVELFAMQIGRVASCLENDQLPEAGDIYLLRTSASNLSAFYVRLGYEDLEALDSHEPSLTYLEEICFAVMTADLTNFTENEWRALLEKLEPLRELGQNNELLTLDQALTNLDEDLQ